MRFEFATANRILFGPGACSEVPALVEQSQKSNSMKGNPVELTGDELMNILSEDAA